MNILKRIILFSLVLCVVGVPVFSCLAAAKVPTIDYSCKSINPDCIVGGVFKANVKSDVECACCGKCELSSFTRLAVVSVDIILGLVGSLALLVFVYGGMLWILSAGNPERVTKGKQAIISAVIGVVIVFTAYILINFVVKSLTSYDISQWQEIGAGQTTIKK